MADKGNARVVSRVKKGTVMRQGETYPYEIILHNFRTFEGNKTVDIVRGQSVAERVVDDLNNHLTAEEREAGWSHFLQRTTRKPRPKANRHVANLKPGSFRKR